MNKIKKLLLSLFSLAVITANATPQDDLKVRLDGFNALNADFKQEVIRLDGSLLSTSEGTLAIQKPDSLMMHTISPDEQYLFTKDTSVYFYDPFVNQLSIFAKDDLNTAPFLLLNSNDPKLWSQYTVTNKAESFTLKPKVSQDFSEISLNFKGNILDSLVIVMKNGNQNTYKLQNQSSNVSSSDFYVEIPEDVEVDDER